MILLGSTHLHGQRMGFRKDPRQNLTESPRVYNLLNKESIQVVVIVHKSKVVLSKVSSRHIALRIRCYGVML